MHQEAAMGDFLALISTVVFFAIAIAYVIGCEQV
jgi:hypothetical protein